MMDNGILMQRYFFPTVFISLSDNDTFFDVTFICVTSIEKIWHKQEKVEKKPQVGLKQKSAKEKVLDVLCKTLKSILSLIIK
jgi:hypothetical protein